MKTPEVSELWKQRVASIEISRIRQMVGAIPAGWWMSFPLRTFVPGLVEENRRRLVT